MIKKIEKSVSTIDDFKINMNNIIENTKMIFENNIKLKIIKQMKDIKKIVIIQFMCILILTIIDLININKDVLNIILVNSMVLFIGILTLIFLNFLFVLVNEILSKKSRNSLSTSLIMYFQEVLDSASEEILIEEMNSFKEDSFLANTYIETTKTYKKMLNLFFYKISDDMIFNNSSKGE